MGEGMGDGSQRHSKSKARRRRRGKAQAVIKGLTRRLGMRVSTLHAFLDRLCTEQDKKILYERVEASTVDFKKDLETYLVAIEKEGPCLTLEKPTMYFHELVDKAVQSVVKGRAPHVLGFGYRSISQYGGNGTVRSMYGVESTWVNTTVSFLKSSKLFTQLHTMIGDSSMLHTLVHACILHPLDNNCFAQISGPPLSSVVMSLGQPPLASPASTSVPPTTATSSVGPSSAPPSLGCQHLRASIPGSTCGIMPRSPPSLCFSTRGAAKLLKTPSWSTRSRRATTGVRESTVISRTPMYYNSTFGRKAGLPGGHMLNQIAKGSRGATALTLYIFDGKPLAKIGGKKSRCSGNQGGGGLRDSSEANRRGLHGQQGGCARLDGDDKEEDDHDLTMGRKRRGNREGQTGRGSRDMVGVSKGQECVSKRANNVASLSSNVASLSYNVASLSSNVASLSSCGAQRSKQPNVADDTDVISVQGARAAAQREGMNQRLRVRKGLRGALKIVSAVLSRHASGQVDYSRLLQRHCSFAGSHSAEKNTQDDGERGSDCDDEEMQFDEDEHTDDAANSEASFGCCVHEIGGESDARSQPRGDHGKGQRNKIIGGGMLGSGYRRPQSGKDWEDETVSLRQVCGMMRCVMRRLLPRKVWGCKENEAAFASGLRCFLSLRRFDKFVLGRALKGIKITKCEWLYPTGVRVTSQGHISAKRKMASWLHFVYTQLVVSLARANFYVTENEASKLRMTWYRKPVWARVRATSVLGSKYQELSRPQSVSCAGIQNSCPGALRLLPRGNGKGVRPILNLGRQKAPSQRFPYGVKSVNFRLREALAVLSLETKRQPMSLGSTVKGQTQMLESLLAVIRSWKAAGKPPMNFASIDIQKSFDTLKVSKLLEVVDQTLSEPEYLVKRFAVWSPARGLRFSNKAMSANQYRPFLREAEIFAETSRNTIFTDLVEYCYTKRESINTIVSQHLKGNVVEMSNKFLLQVAGIPQGSNISSLLCCLMYGHMEKFRLSSLPSIHTRGSDLNAVLSDGKKAGDEGDGQKAAGVTKAVEERDMSLLMRVVDDFLYISPSSSHAKAFARTMGAGNPDYGAHINDKKSKVNFPVQVCQNGSNFQLPMLGDNGEGLLRWCGLKLDTKRLCVSLDLRRFTGHHIRDALTMPSAPKVRVLWQRQGAFSRAVKDKVVAAAKSKLHPILLDREINPPTEIRRNIYQVLAITAMKHVAYIESSHSAMHAPVILSILRCIHPYIVGLSKRRDFKSFGVDISLRKIEFMWLGVDAYAKVLKRKGATFKAARDQLKDELASVEAALNSTKSVEWLRRISHNSWDVELRAVRY